MKHIALLVLLTALLIAPYGCDRQPSADRRRIAQLERERDRAEKEKNRWQTYAVIALGLGGVLLVVGSGLGSSARRAAAKHERSKGK